MPKPKIVPKTTNKKLRKMVDMMGNDHWMVVRLSSVFDQSFALSETIGPDGMGVICNDSRVCSFLVGAETGTPDERPAADNKTDKPQTTAKTPALARPNTVCPQISHQVGSPMIFNLNQRFFAARVSAVFLILRIYSHFFFLSNADAS